MKSRKKLFNRKIAYYAYCYYTKTSDVNFEDTALFISNFFKKKYSRNDIGKMFRHIVIFGRFDDTAKLLAETVNLRNNHNKKVYNRFLNLRYQYQKLLKKFSECSIILYEKEQLEFQISEYKNYSNSELDEDNYYTFLTKKYQDVCEELEKTDLHYISNLIKNIEKYCIKELLLQT